MKTRKLWKAIAVLAAVALGLAVTACDGPTGPQLEHASIGLSVTETQIFGPFQVGYAEVTPLTVTVTNTGDQATGELTVTLDGENADAFAAYPATIASIAVGGSASFTVGPNHGLVEGTYTATVTVSGEPGITAQSFGLTFTVSENIPAPDFGISLSVTGTQIFGPFQVGYAEITPITVTVTNIGTQATGALTLTLDGDDADSFAASAISPSNIPAGESASFTVGPNHGLAVGLYTATVTVSGGSGITARSFGLSFEVTEDAPAPTFIISLDAPVYHPFPYAQIGYSAVTPLTVTVTNTGDQATGELTVTLDGENADAFAAHPDTIASIPVDGTATFTVGPIIDLPVSTHTATVTVSGRAEITSQSFEVSFEVRPIPPTFEVDFNTHGGTPVPSTQTIQYGQMATRPALDPTRTGYIFVGWFTTAETGGTEFDFDSTPITADTTIHARWQPGTGAKDFTIDFADFTNPIPEPEITGPDLSLRDNKATGEISITGLPENATVNWFFQNDPVANGTTFADGTAILVLNQALHGGMIGTHAVTVEVLTDGRLYSRIITFRVML